MQNIFTNIKCSEIILYNTNENWYVILFDLFSRLCYIATSGPFCKEATQMVSLDHNRRYNLQWLLLNIYISCLTIIRCLTIIVRLKCVFSCDKIAV